MTGELAVMSVGHVEQAAGTHGGLLISTGPGYRGRQAGTHYTHTLLAHSPNSCIKEEVWLRDATKMQNAYNTTSTHHHFSIVIYNYSYVVSSEDKGNSAICLKSTGLGLFFI